MPYLSLAVDGLTDNGGVRESLELRPEELAANDEQRPDTHLPDTKLDPEQLEVYGWESSFWKKILGYVGL